MKHKLYSIKDYLHTDECLKYLGALTGAFLEPDELMALIEEGRVATYLALNDYGFPAREAMVGGEAMMIGVIGFQKLCSKFSLFEYEEKEGDFRFNPPLMPWPYYLELEGKIYADGLDEGKAREWSLHSEDVELKTSPLIFLPVDIEALAAKMNGEVELCDYQKEIEALKAEIGQLKAEQGALKDGATVNNEINPRKEEALYKLVIGMAQRGYGYNPNAKKNDAISEIQRDLDELGLGLGERTIRNHLNAAKAFLPAKPIKT